MKISIEKLKEIGACQKGKDYFLDVIGDGEYTIAECIDKIKASGNYPTAYDVCWLICEVPEMRTKEVYQLYVDCKPTAPDVRLLMYYFPEMRTKEVYQLFFDCNPTADDIRLLMYNVPEMQKYEEK